MGFDVNFNKPVIKEAQAAKDGGAGNLGYFQRDEEEKKKQNEKSIFEETEIREDSFKKSVENDTVTEDFSFSKLIAKIIFEIKSWAKKTFNLK